MKLYLLIPVNGWKPWYDKCFGVIVRAESVEQARKFASEKAGDEGKSVWFNELQTKCEELTNEGKAEVIMVDFASA